MKKYKVLKEFVDNQGALRPAGEVFEDYGTYPMLTALLGNGFIEEIKEDKRWAALPGSKYYVVDEYLTTDHHIHNDWPNDRYRQEAGNCFKSQETAEKVAEALRQVFSYLHTPKELGLNEAQLDNDIYYVLNEARQAVLEDDKQN